MNDIVQYQGHAIATAAEMVSHTLRVQEVLQSVMKKDVHYGIIPGTTKNTLYKPGAELLCATFHIAPTYPEIIEERFPDGVRIRVRCVGIHQGSGLTVAEGLGSCNSMEEKYKWCKAYKREFDATPPDRRRMQYGYNKSERKEYEVMQVRVETADIENTLLKMASKRAMIAMTLNALAASDAFAQDLEDLSKKVLDMMTEDDTGEDGKKKEGVKTPQSKSGNGNGHDGGHSAGDGDADKTPASSGMVTFLRKALEKATLTEAECLKKFDLEKLDGMTVSQANAAIAWTRNPAA